MKLLYTSVLLATTLAPSVLAFPHMAGLVDRDDSFGHGHGHGHGHGDGVKVVYPEPMSFNGAKKIPDAAHPWKKPGPNDKRGPCPGLNTLANHGYLPRSGVASVEELINGVQEGFNMGYGFAKAVSSFAILGRGNPLLNKVSIGGESSLVPPLPGNLDGTPGGLAKHGRFEGDVSMTREDAALGDHVNLVPELYNNLLSFVDKYGDGDIVTTEVFIEYRWDRFLTLNKTNPDLVYHKGRKGFSYGEAGLILNLFRNSKVGNLTLSDMKSFLEHERFPDNWYRREAPFEFTDISKAVDEVEDPRTVEPGAKNVEGDYIPDSLAYNPYFDTPCATYYDLAGLNLAADLVNTTGLLKQNVDTLLGGIQQLFAPGNCSLILPVGPAKV